MSTGLVVRVLMLLIVMGLAQGCDQTQRQEPADLVFRGGAVYTVNPDQPWAEAVAVRHGQITYVGDEAGIDSHIGETTEIIEIGDGMLMPGFHDAHMHPMAAGTSYLRCPLNDLAWPDAVLARLSECESELDSGEWLRATGIDAEILAGQGPGIAFLDEISGDRPAFITDRMGDNAWANTRALEIAGIDGSMPDPDEGAIVRDANTGQPSGILRGHAVWPVWDVASRYSQRALLQGLKLASQKANSLGITSSNEAMTLPFHVEAYRTAEKAGNMTLRVQAAMLWSPESSYSQVETLESEREQKSGRFFRPDSVKLYVDGDAMEGTASLLEPYIDSGDFGTSYYGAELAELLTRLDAAGFQIHMHAYGDRAVRDGLDAIETAIASNPPWDRRHQLAHIALIHPDDLPRFRALDVTANIQPLWAWMDEGRAEECHVLGPERCKQLLAFRDLIDSGARVVAGSDWISDSMNPLYNIQIAMTRRAPDGSGPAWNPDQRVSLEEMLEAYTINAAWQAGQEELTGSIEVGKSADLVVLERNLFEVDPMHLKDVRVRKTFLEGKLVYSLD